MLGSLANFEISNFFINIVNIVIKRVRFLGWFVFTLFFVTIFKIIKPLAFTLMAFWVCFGYIL
jgi:hypothetical protein